MSSNKKDYAVLATFAGIIVLAVAFGIVADSGFVAIQIDGAMLSFFDPFAWLVAAPAALLIRSKSWLAAALLTLAIIYTIAWIFSGMLASNLSEDPIVPAYLFGFLLVGYIQNAIAVFRRARRAD